MTTPRVASHADAHEPDHARPRVVLVDDHPMVRKSLTFFLEDVAGVEVVAAVEDSTQGHRAVLEHRPDLALIDNRLPDGRGVDLASVLREEAPEVGVIMLSGSMTDGEAASARRNGVLDVAVKDRPDALLKVLSRHTGHRSRQRSTG